MAAKKKSPLNPKVIIIAVVLLLLVGVGISMMMGKNTSKDGSVSTGSNAFTSIKDAFSKSLSLECEFTDETGTKSKVFIKNGAMRGDFEGGEAMEAGSMIFKEKKMYFWNGKEGSMMTIPDAVEGDTTTTDTQSLNPDNFFKEVEQYKDSCKPAVVSDSLFTAPADVTFTDLSKMMESVPQGNTVPEGSGMTEEDIKKIMEQYQTEE